MALITCPECGFEVSDQAFSCPRCGFPIKKNNAAGDVLTNSERKTRSEKKSYSKVILWSLIFVFVIVCILVYRNNSSLINNWLSGSSGPRYTYSNQSSAPVYVPTVHTKYLIQGSIVARATEKYRHIDFSTVAGSTNNRVEGRFQAYGGTGDDIRIMIMTQDDYTNYVNGHTASTYYNSGITTVDNLDVSLPAGYGLYTLIIDNFFSVVTDKEVRANIRLLSTF